MLVKFLAAMALAYVVVRLLGFAFGLRAQMRAREAERANQESRGRRVVAELPLEDGVVLFLEDAAGFYWRDVAVAKASLSGARLVLNGGGGAQAARAGALLPAAAAAAEFDGSEQWEVVLHLKGAATRRVPCGRLREGVSRDAASAVFDASKQALAASPARL